MGKIDAHLHDNPQLIGEFMKQHGDILRELRRRLEMMLAYDDIVSRYLLVKGLQETIQIASEVARELLSQKIKERGVMIMPDVKHPKVH